MNKKIHNKLKFTDQILTSAYNFLSILAAPLFLSVSDTGLFVLVQSIFMFFLLINQGLLVSPFQVVLSKFSLQVENAGFYLDRINKIFYWLIIFYCLTILLALALWYYASYIEIKIELWFSIVFYILSHLIYEFSRRFAYLTDKIKFVVFISIASNITRLTSIYLYSVDGVTSYFNILSLSAFVGGCILFAINARYAKKDASLNLTKCLSEHHVIGKSLLLNAMLGWAVAYSPLFVIGNTLGPAAIGIVGACRSITGVFNVFGEFLENAVVSQYALVNGMSTKEKKADAFKEYFNIYMIFWTLFHVVLILCLMNKDMIFEYYKFIDFDIIFILLYASLFYTIIRIRVLKERLSGNVKFELSVNACALILTLIVSPVLVSVSIGSGALIFLAPWLSIYLYLTFIK